jgi:hypothetical protein
MLCVCEHPKGLHLRDRCRINGCPCDGFREPGADSGDAATGPRRVTTDVPDGYMLSISLVPYTEQPLEDVEAGAADG